MWNADNWTKGFADATKGLTEALEKTGEAITQAATKAKPRERAPVDTDQNQGTKAPSPPPTDETSENESQDASASSSSKKKDMPFQKPELLFQVPPQFKNVNQDKMLQTFQTGWSSMLEGTKQAVEATREAVELEKLRLEQNFLQKTQQNRFYKRDLKLPLDVEALRDAQVVYITDRIITMSHPAMASERNPNLTAPRKLAAVGQLLQRRHDGRFLVWNLSEVEYDASVLDDQLLTFSFPGSPSPPLGLLLKILVSMENWMKADERNVAVVHCLTGKGRTSTVLAAFLCWMGEAGFGDIPQALEYIAKCKKISPQDLTIPSQRRYASYFQNMLDGVRPSQPPLLLKRIIMSEAPKFAKGPPREHMESTPPDDPKLMGCAPYLQLFKGGKLIYTAAATLHVQQPDEELPFVQVVDGTVPFHVEQVLQGDILIRCRHMTFQKQRVSMFRAAFHTGYVPPNVLRLSKSQLDGACHDRRFSDDFFLDLIFEKVDAETATRHFEQQEEEEQHAESKGNKGKGPVVKASSYDAMLQGDSRFWDVIAERRQEHSSKNKDESSDPTWGRTVGRRRGDQGKSKEKTDGKATAVGAKDDNKAFSAFSIGNEFDFLPVDQASNQSQKRQQPAAEKDALMEALGALDEDETETEEVVFDDSPTSSVVSSEQRPTSEEGSVSTPPPIDAAATNQEVASEAAAAAASSKEVAPTQISSSNDDADLEDMDALLAAADEDLGDMDLDDFNDDDDDEDLGDLEAMLKEA